MATAHHPGRVDRLPQEGARGHQRESRRRAGVPPRTGSSPVTLDERLTRLRSMSTAEVKAEWRRVFGTPAPPAFGTALTTRAIAARYQEQALGGLSKGELRILKR